MCTPRKGKPRPQREGPTSGRWLAEPSGEGVIAAAWLPMALLAAATGGCADPQGKFDEFSEAMANRPAAEVTECGEDRLTVVEGTFFAALAPDLDPSKPVVALAEISSDGAGMHLVLQPLRADDRETPVGEPIDFPAAPLSDAGEFRTGTDPIVVPEAANPLGRGDIEMTSVGLSGTACEQLICGDWWGPVTAPIVWDLQADLSHFAMVPLEPGESPPEPPPINCAGDLAGVLE